MKKYLEVSPADFNEILPVDTTRWLIKNPKTIEMSIAPCSRYKRFIYGYFQCNKISEM